MIVTVGIWTSRDENGWYAGVYRVDDGKEIYCTTWHASEDKARSEAIGWASDKMYVVRGWVSVPIN